MPQVRAAIGLVWVVGLAVVCHEIRQPRVRAGGVVGRIGQGEDGIKSPLREAFLIGDQSGEHF